MKKVQILALHLGYGGIEKAITDFANNISSFCNVEIISTYKLFDKPIYKLNDNIKVKYLINNLQPNRNEFKKALKSFHLIRAFKEGIISSKVLFLKKKLMKNEIINSDADILISTRPYHNNLLSKYGDKSKLRIAWEHNHYHNHMRYFKEVLNSSKQLDYLVLVSEALKNDYEKAMNTNCKCVFIPNMIDIDKPRKSNVDNNNLITVSRLSKEKGLFDLINVIKRVKNEVPDVKMNLIGDGVLFDQIKELVQVNNLEDCVEMPGFKDSDFIHSSLYNSSLYVMTSYTESFGIALLEAFSHGVPAIAFDSAEGARELINGENGKLVSDRDVEKMSDQIIFLLNNKKELKQMSSEAIKTYKKYLPDIVIDKWKNILHL